MDAEVGTVEEAEAEGGVGGADVDDVLRYVAREEGGRDGLEVCGEGVRDGPGGVVSGCNRDEMR